MEKSFQNQYCLYILQDAKKGKKIEENKPKKIEQMNKEELLAKAKELEIVIEKAEEITKAQIIEMIKEKETPQE